MSTIDRQSTATGVSRRTVVRGIAWTAPAVSIAVAAPAYAACSVGPCTTVSSLSILKEGGSTKHLTWTLSLTNDSANALTSLSVSFAGSVINNVIALQSVSSSFGTWAPTGSGAGGATFTGSIPAGETITLVVVWTRSTNSGGSVKAAFTANSQPVLPTLGPIGY